MTGIRIMHDQEVERCIALYNQSPRLTYQEIADKMQVPLRKVSSVISNLLRNKVIVKRNNTTGMPRNFGSKQLALIERITEFRQQGLTWGKIGIEIGQTYQTVYDFVSTYDPALLKVPRTKAFYKEIAALYNQLPRLTYEQIADSLGVSLKFVTYRIDYMQDKGILQKRTGTGVELSPTQEQLDRLGYIMKLRKQNKSWNYIGGKLGISGNSVKSYVHFYVKKTFDGDDVMKSLREQSIGNLSQSQIEHLANIKRLRKKGLTWKGISLELGVTHQAVHSFVVRYDRDFLREVTVYRPNPETDELIQLYNQVPRLTYTEIAAKMGITPKKIMGRIAYLQTCGRVQKRLIR